MNEENFTGRNWLVSLNEMISLAKTAPSRAIKNFKHPEINTAGTMKFSHALKLPQNGE